ncbi:MAG: hypothetical protein M3Q27_08835 [Actinomycetota bacterium]|nr:hypothetical protein [Actinomycetota bacterium]
MIEKARGGPSTYYMESMRSLIREELSWARIAPRFAVVTVLGALVACLNVRVIGAYD